MSLVVPAGAVLALAWWAAPRRVVVTGESMLPGFQPGDRLVVVRVMKLRPGQVVAVRDPRHDERLLVKRVRRRSGRGVDVRGDNPEASTDSRQFGLVGERSVIGRVVYRYHPASRAGWWPN